MCVEWLLIKIEGHRSIFGAEMWCKAPNDDGGQRNPLTALSFVLSLKHGYKRPR
jgi:hypothetical protein